MGEGDCVVTRVFGTIMRHCRVWLTMTVVPIMLCHTVATGILEIRMVSSSYYTHITEPG